MARLPELKLLTWENLPEFVTRLRADGKRIVTTNGCFDLLHWGHLQYLSEARALGDVLICALNSDASVHRLKGPTRPIWPERVRALQLAALECVDGVVVFDEDTPIRFLETVRPDVHVKGADYTGRRLVEEDALDKWGGKLHLAGFAEGFSTTSLIERLKALPDEKGRHGREIHQIELEGDVHG